MKDRLTKIELTSEDTAIVLRGDGKMELFLRNTRDKKDNKPTQNEIVAYVISNLMKDPKWIEQTIELFESKKNTGQI